MLHTLHTLYPFAMKRSVRNQEVTDAQGRRRFHGAFTGGFSAGYFNSVGTKEGWTPSTFSSSRDNRSSRLEQRAEDFMDEEDDPLLGKRLETTEHYDTLQTGAKRRLQETTGRSDNAVIPGFTLPTDWLLPVNESVGATLLKQMGWKEGHGIGQQMRKRKFMGDKTTKDVMDEEEVYVPPRNDFNVQKAFPKPKLDRYGAGFDPYTNAPEFSRYKQQREDKQREQDGSHRQVVSFADAMKTTSGSNRATTAYGLSALEENDDVDVYGTVSMAEFDRVIAPLSERNAVKRLDSSSLESRRHDKVSRSRSLCTDGRPVLPGFELARAKEKPPKSVNLRLAVPAGFKAYHRFDDREAPDDAVTTLYRKFHFSTDKSNNSNVVTAKERSALLGDDDEGHAGKVNTTTSETKVSGSIFDMLGEEQKAKLFNAAAQAKQGQPAQKASRFVSAGTEQPSVPKTRQPLVSGSGDDAFRAMISASIAKRFVSSNATAGESKKDANQHGEVRAKASRRSQRLWIPKSLLCKRFHVKCDGPTGSSGKDDDSDKKRDLFDEELVPHLVEFAAGRTARSKSKERTLEATGSAVAAIGNGELPPLPVADKASASLLKSIFEPSDESDVVEDVSEDSDDEDDGDQVGADNRSDKELHQPAASIDDAIAVKRSFRSDRQFASSDGSSSSDDVDKGALLPTGGDNHEEKGNKKRLQNGDSESDSEDRRKHKKHKKHHHKHRSSRSDKDKKRKKDKKDKKDKDRKEHRSSRHSRRSRSKSRRSSTKE